MASRTLISPLSHDRRSSHCTQPSGTPNCPAMPARRPSDAPCVMPPMVPPAIRGEERCPHIPVTLRGPSCSQRDMLSSRAGLKKTYTFSHTHTLRRAHAHAHAHARTRTHSPTYYIRRCMLNFMKLNHNKLKELQILRQKKNAA